MGFNSAFEGLNSVFYNAVQLVEKKNKKQKQSTRFKWRGGSYIRKNREMMHGNRACDITHCGAGNSVVLLAE